MVEAVRTFTTVDADLMSLLHLEPRRIFDIGVGNPLCADVDATLADARATISQQLDVATRGPRRLADLFGAFTWVLAIDTLDEVQAFVATAPPLDEYVARVREFHEVRRRPACERDANGNANANGTLPEAAREYYGNGNAARVCPSSPYRVTLIRSSSTVVCVVVVPGGGGGWRFSGVRRETSGV